MKFRFYVPGHLSMPARTGFARHDSEFQFRVMAHDGVIQQVKPAAGIALVRLHQSGEHRWCQVIGLGGLSGRNGGSFLRYVPPIGTEVVVVFTRFQQPRIVAYHTGGHDDEKHADWGADEGAAGYAETQARKSAHYRALVPGEWHMRAESGAELFLGADTSARLSSGASLVRVRPERVRVGSPIIVLDEGGPPTAPGRGVNVTAGVVDEEEGAATPDGDGVSRRRVFRARVESASTLAGPRHRLAAVEVGELSPEDDADGLPKSPFGSPWRVHLRAHGTLQDRSAPITAEVGLTQDGDALVRAGRTARIQGGDIELADGDGGAGENLVLAEALAKWLETSFTVPTAMGPSGQPLAPLMKLFRQQVVSAVRVTDKRKPPG